MASDAIAEQVVHEGGASGRLRWLALAVIGIAQLMVVLDLTVMNVALPSAQQALHFTTADRQWVVTAYTLAFGSLLLLGGRPQHVEIGSLLSLPRARHQVVQVDGTRTPGTARLWPASLAARRGRSAA